MEKKHQCQNDLFLFSKPKKHSRHWLLNFNIVVGVVVSCWKEKKLKMAKCWMGKYSNWKTKGNIPF